MAKKIICFLFGIPVVLAGLLGVTGFPSDMTWWVLLVAGIMLLIIGVRTKTAKKKKQELESSIQNNKAGDNKKFQINHLNGYHIAGLPLAENADCILGFEQNCFTFTGGGNEFSLNFDKITGVDVKTNEEIQKQYVSSVGGAVGGALLFGPLGAIVGGRAKAKNAKTVSYFLIFTYQKNDEIAYISFEIPTLSLPKAKEFKAMFDSKYKTAETIKVEL